MTHQAYLDWLDKEIKTAEHYAKEQDYDPEAAAYCNGHAHAYKEAKEKYMQLIENQFPSQPIESNKQ